MQNFLILILLISGLKGYSQTPKISYAQNTRLTIRLLDSIKSKIDSTFKLLVIKGDIYDDKSFHLFAKRNHFMCVFIRGNLNNNCMNTQLKSVVIKISSNPYLATVEFIELTFDYFGNIIGTLSMNLPKIQKWNFNKFNRVVRLTD